MFDQVHTIEMSGTEAATFQDFKPIGKMRALDLCQRLAKDDAFRDAMVREPLATLSEYGFELNAEDLPEGGVKLPSKDVMVKHMDIIATRFAESQAIIMYFAL
jgi:hypothetical protein